MKSTVLIWGGTLSLLLASTSVLADGSESGFGSYLESVETSDDIKRNSLGIEYQGATEGGLGYGLEASTHRLDDDGTRYKANAIKAKGEVKLNDMLFFEGAVGSDKISQDGGNKSRQLTTVHARAEARFGEQGKVGIQHDKGFLYTGQVLTNANGDLLSAETTRVDAEYRPVKQVKLGASTARRKLSDGNSSRQTKVGAQYGIVPDWPSVWVGVEAEQLNFDRQDDGYWTPDHYRGVAATFNGNYVVSEKVELNSGLSIGRSKEAGSEAGTGYYASVGGNVAVTDNANLSADVHYISSQQKASEWNETGARIGLTFKHH